MNIIHKNLAQGRWYELSLSEQMANIGSEIERAIKWYKNNESVYWGKALERALELFDFTLNDSRWRGRYKEIARMREVVCDLFYGENTYHTTFESLKKYFYYFALAARKGR